MATNVKTQDGQRAIGTYLPAKNADGSPNAVLAAALGGKQYTGTANVVGTWYVTSYIPLADRGGVHIVTAKVGEVRQAVTKVSADAAESAQAVQTARTAAEQLSRLGDELTAQLAGFRV